MTDAERIAQLEREVAELRSDQDPKKHALAVALRHGVTDPDDIDLIVSSSATGDLLEALAARLKELSPR